MEKISTREMIVKEAHNNAIREAMIELYKLDKKSVEMQEVIGLLENLLRK